MHIVTGTIDFPTVSGRGPQTQSVEVELPTDFTKATAILSGFVVEYSNQSGLPNRGDHHLGQLDVRLQSEIVPNKRVRVTATLGLRDWSVNIDSRPWDDPYDGSVRFTIIAE